MRKLTFGMNLSLDGYIAAPGDDLGWSVPSDELFQWWSDRVGAAGGRELSGCGPGGGGRGRVAWGGGGLGNRWASVGPPPATRGGAPPARLGSARRWRDMPKVVFSSTTSAVDWNTRLVTG